MALRREPPTALRAILAGAMPGWAWTPLILAMLGAGCEPNRSARNAPPAQPAAAPAPGPEVASSPRPIAGTEPTGVTLQTLDYEGIQRLIEGHRGKVVVMDAWSTSCQPCLIEFPHLVELHRRHGPERLACISLSFDYEGLGPIDDVKPPVERFLKSQAATFDNVLSSEESDVLYRKFELASVPAVFVYDQAGRLRKRFDNQKAKSKDERFTYEQVGQLVAELLDEAAPDRATP